MADERDLAELQTLLEGVGLPASKSDLVERARGEDADAKQIAALERLPEGEYASLDDVAEALRPKQPSAPAVLPPAAAGERGAPPGRSPHGADG